MEKMSYPELLVELQKHKALIDDYPHYVCSLDLAGIITGCNKGYEEWSGYTESELCHMHFKELMPAEDRERAVQQFQKNPLQEVLSGIEYRVRKKNGTVSWVSGTIVPIVVDGKRTGLYAVTRDITRKRELESQLNRQQEMLAHLQRIAHVGSWEIDPLLDGSYWSEELFHIFGIPNTGFITIREILEFVHPDDRDYFESAARQMMDGKPYDSEFRIIRPDGELRILRSRRELIPDNDGGTRMIGTTQDITDLKRTERLLIDAEKLAYVGRLAAGIAHEIRNPLTSISGFLQLLKSKYGDVDAMYFDIIENELKRIEMISSELLALGKPHAVSYRPHKVMGIIDSLLELLKPQMAARRIELQLHVDPCPPVMCAENQLRQAFMNILKNGVESMSDGGTLHIALGCSQDRLVVLFQDSGVGMSNELLQKIGDPFFTTKPTGNGLGLMITRNIIQTHGGSLEFDSTEGLGTSVIVRLPVTQHVDCSDMRQTEH